MELIVNRALLAAAGLAVLVAAGCQRRDADEDARPTAAPAAEAPLETPADQAAPLTYESTSQHAEVELSLPPAVRSQPDLHVRLYREGVAQLRQFAEGAQADRTEYGGDMDLPAFSQSIEWTAGAETGKLLSLRRQTYDYAGGAHPNAAYGALLWDKALKRVVEPAQLFRRGADLSALDQALCAAINAAKRERSPDAQAVTLDGTGGFACPRALQTPFVLAPSTTGGRAGGLVFLISPYVVGPWAEGGYEVVVPQAEFRALVAPAYADEFAGAPPQAAADAAPRG